MSIGKRIKELKISLRATSGTIADTLGIPVRTIGSYEREEAQPSPKFLAALIEKYNVNSQPYIPKNKDLNYYKNAQLQPSQHQLLPNTNVDNQLYKLNLSKSSNIPGKFYVIKSVDEANIIRVRNIYIYLHIQHTYSQLVLTYGVVQ